ncbi:MAG: SHOCT domain-containing protein [Nakamurella sp.]
MPAPLTPAGEAVISELAQRYRVSDGAVRALLDAVVRGGGGMAQFAHPDLGGSGQWMRGGMTMVGDMFNPGLQATVSGICSELSAKIGGGAVLISRSEGASTGGGTAFGDAAGFAGGGNWWPAELGRPGSSGGQNDDAYAYFPGPRRLAIRHGHDVTIYDTGDHVISGVQQQQGGRGSLEFSSQFGSFTVDTLPLVEEVDTHRAARSANAPPAPAPASRPAGPVAPAQQATTEQVAPPGDAAAAAEPSTTASAEAPTVPAPTAAGGAGTASEIGAAIETLAGLRDKGFLTADEFTAKKTELLARL